MGHQTRSDAQYERPHRYSGLRPATPEDRHISHERRRQRRCCGITAEGLRCKQTVSRADGLFCHQHNPARPRDIGALSARGFHRLYTEGRVPQAFYDDLAAGGLDFKLITWEMRLRALEAWTYALESSDRPAWHEEMIRLRAKQAQRLETYVAQAKRGYPGAGRMGELAWLLVHGEFHPRAGRKTRQRYLKPGEKVKAIAEDQARRAAYLEERKIKRRLARKAKREGRSSGA